VPILRKRGLFREEYDSHTLRGHFGLGELRQVPGPQLEPALAA
jgi:hypothetical protein